MVYRLTQVEWTVKMSRETIPVVSKQLALLGSVVALPILLSAAVVFAFPLGHDATSAEMRLAAALLLLCVLLVGGLLASIVMRRSIVLDADSLTVKHSFYTIRFRKDQLQSVKIMRLVNADQLGLTTKRNGVAAFSFYSGWFYVDSGQICFCAVSSVPIYQLRFIGSIPCRLLAVSCSEAMAEAIRAWKPEPTLAD